MPQYGRILLLFCYELLQINLVSALAASFNASYVRRRCRGRLACDWTVPAIEIENAIFYKGEVYLNNIDSESTRVLAEARNFYASEPGRLPSVLVQMAPGNADWLPGPAIKYSSQFPGPIKCLTTWDTTAYFLFPWETHNAYHSLNDNLFAVLSSMLLSSQTGLCSNQTIGFDADAVTLFLFRNLQTPALGKLDSLLFNLLSMALEGAMRNRGRIVVQPAKKLLWGGPHCVRRLVWGTSLKVMYRDTLINLRRAVYLTLRAALAAHPRFPSRPAPELREPPMPREARPARGSGGANGDIPVRVIIVTRNATMTEKSPFRKLSTQSELEIARGFQARGALASVCCDFERHVDSPEKLLSFFAFADICVGIHGAALANCALLNNNAVLLELQVDHAFGFDSFMKIAHMTNGTYVFYDVRSAATLRGQKGAGFVLTTNIVAALVDIALRELQRVRNPHPGSTTGTGDARLLHDGYSIPTQPMQQSKLSSGKNAGAKAMRERKRERSRAELGRRSPILASNGSSTSSSSYYYSSSLRVGEGDNGRGRAILESGTNGSPNFWIVRSPGPLPSLGLGLGLEDLSQLRGGLRGPRGAETVGQCKLLPYYEFRLRTMPEKEHRFKCDEGKIQTKASGRIGHMLLNDFI